MEVRSHEPPNGQALGPFERTARNEGAIDAIFEAVADATEEAILNSMFRAHTVVGRDGNARQALPLDVVLERLRSAGRL